MLKRLYDIIRQFREFFLYGLCVTVSVFLLTLNDTTQIRTIRSLAVVSAGFLQDAVSVLPNYFNLRKENRALREQNLRLSDEVSRLREARLETIRLRRLLGLTDALNYQYKSANVVGKTLQLMRNTVTLDIGERDSIRPNMPVVTERGLVGKILFCAPSHSVGQLLFNNDMRVSAKVQRSRVDGIVRWMGGNYLSLQNVAKTLDVRPGDVVITSEYSNIFPPGIRIGTVARTREAPGSLFQTIEIEPSVDLLTFEEVFVLLIPQDSSRLSLEGHLREYAGTP